MRYFLPLILFYCLACEPKQYMDCNKIHELKNIGADYLSIRSQYDSLKGLYAMNSSFIDLKGKSKRLYEEEGHVVVINFWFIGCKPCMAEMPFFMEMKESYQGKDVSFFSVAKNSKEDLQTYIEKTQFNWPIYLADQVRYEYCVNSYPTTLILDKKMRILYYSTGGPIKKEAIAENIDRLHSIIDKALIE